MTDNIPVIHIHEARLNGVFDLPPADMPYITYQGRTMLVLLADAIKISIGDTKDGDTKASWVFKAVDAAVVREESMRDHLAKTLYLEDELPDGLAVRHDGSVHTEDLYPPDQREAWSLTDPEALGTVTVAADAPENVDEETGEILEVERKEEENPRSSLFGKPVKQRDDSVRPSNNGHNSELPGEVETYGRPVHYKDKTLAGFMDED